MTKSFLLFTGVALLSLSAFSANAQQSGEYVPLDKYDANRRAKTLNKQPASISYVALKGASLRATLEHWAKISVWQEVVWKLPADTDFTLGASGRYEGDFLSVTKELISSFGSEGKLRIQFHSANKVVSVEEDLE